MTLLVCLLASSFALHVGDAVPPISGVTLAQQTLTLPEAGLGKAAAIVISFSRAAGEDSRLWNEHLDRDRASIGPFERFTVIMLEQAPSFIRGMVVSKIKSSMPRAEHAKTLIVYKDENLWKQRIGVSDDTHAYVLLLDKDGKLAWTSTRRFSEIDYTEVKRRICELTATACGA